MMHSGNDDVNDNSICVMSKGVNVYDPVRAIGKRIEHC